MSRPDPAPLLAGKVEVSQAGAVAWVARLDGTLWHSPTLAYAAWARADAEREHAVEGIEWMDSVRWGNHVALRATRRVTAASTAAALGASRTALLGAELLTAIAARAGVEGGYLEDSVISLVEGSDGRALRLDVRGTLYHVTIAPAVVPMRTGRQ